MRLKERLRAICRLLNAGTFAINLQLQSRADAPRGKTDMHCSFRLSTSIIGACLGPLLSASASAHGIVGARFFPATIATDDPFAADELALPTISVFRHLDDGMPVLETDYDMEYSKSIFPGFSISFEAGYVHADPKGEPSSSGFENIELTPTFEVARSDEHEFIASVAFSWEVGGTGSRSIGAESASSYTPKILFGKGFGDLPDSVALLRPLAVTGIVGYDIPGRGDDPH